MQKIDSQTIVNEGASTVYNPVTNETHNMTDWNYDYSDRSYHITTDNGDTMTVTYGDENITIQEGSQAYNVYYLVESSGSGTVSSDGSSSGSGTVSSDGSGSGSGSSSAGGNVGVSGNVSVGGNVNVGGNIQIGVDDELKNPLSRMFSAIAGYFEHLTGSGDDTENQDVIPGDELPASDGDLIDPASDGGLPSVVESVKSWGSGLMEVYTGYTSFLTGIFPYLPSELLALFHWGLAAVVFGGVFRRFFWR